METARMSLIMNWVSCILGGNDLDCETPVALTRKGLRTDGTLENPNSYRFSKCAVTEKGLLRFAAKNVEVQPGAERREMEQTVQ